MIYIISVAGSEDKYELNSKLSDHNIIHWGKNVRLGTFQLKHGSGGQAK